MDNIIRVTKGDAIYRKIFSSNNPFFKTAERFIVEEGEDFVSFTIATSITEDRSLKAIQNVNGSSFFQFRTFVPIGNYIPDEDDSDEDTLYFYFN